MWKTPGTTKTNGFPYCGICGQSRQLSTALSKYIPFTREKFLLLAVKTGRQNGVVLVFPMNRSEKKPVYPQNSHKSQSVDKKSVEKISFR